jgi:hypothetical protein
VADIIGAIEDEMGDRHREVQRETSPSAQAMTQDLWDALQSTVATYLKNGNPAESGGRAKRPKGFQVQERKAGAKRVCFQKTPATRLHGPGTPNSVFALAQAFAPMHKA